MKGMHHHWAGWRQALRMRGAIRGSLARLCQLGVVVLVALTVVSAPAQAASDIVVPGDFPTIQAAVDAAAPGATITVRRGTYIEEVVIAKDVTLKGEGIGKTIIQAPAALTPYAVVVATQVPTVAVVRVTDSAHVTLSGLTVTGPIPCGVAVSGIQVAKDATLKLKDTHVTRIWPEQTCAGFFVGFGIVVGLPPSIEIDGQRGTSGHAIITGVSVDRYQSVGMEVVAPPAGAPSTATIANNRITGGEVGIGVVADSQDTTAVLRGDTIRQTSVAPVQEIECCGFTATAMVQRP